MSIRTDVLEAVAETGTQKDPDEDIDVDMERLVLGGDEEESGGSEPQNQSKEHDTEVDVEGDIEEIGYKGPERMVAQALLELHTREPMNLNVFGEMWSAGQNLILSNKISMQATESNRNRNIHFESYWTT